MLDPAERARLFEDLRGMKHARGVEELEGDGAQLDAAVLLDRGEDWREAAFAELTDDAEGSESRRRLGENAGYGGAGHSSESHRSSRLRCSRRCGSSATDRAHGTS